MFLVKIVPKSLIYNLLHQFCLNARANRYLMHRHQNSHIINIFILSVYFWRKKTFIFIFKEKYHFIWCFGWHLHHMIWYFQQCSQWRVATMGEKYWCRTCPSIQFLDGWTNLSSQFLNGRTRPNSLFLTGQLLPLLLGDVFVHWEINGSDVPLTE